MEGTLSKSELQELSKEVHSGELGAARTLGIYMRASPQPGRQKEQSSAGAKEVAIVLSRSEFVSDQTMAMELLSSEEGCDALNEDAFKRLLNRFEGTVDVSIWLPKFLETCRPALSKSKS
jgi:hypothetical protein